MKACTETDFAGPSACLQAALQLARTVVRGSQGNQVRRKKECLNLTNEAVMLLKPKDRVYERSQTNPILCVGRPFALGAVYNRHFRSGGGALGARAGGPLYLPCLTLKSGDKHGGPGCPPHQSDLLTLMRVQLTAPESSGYLALRCRSRWTGHSHRRSGGFNPK